MRTNAPSSFDVFWPYYLRQHTCRTNRCLHLLGPVVALAAIAALLLARQPEWLPLVPLVAYMPPWLGHFVFERNRPATLGHPLWSLRAEMKMCWLCITRRLEAELIRHDMPVDASLADATDAPRRNGPRADRPQ